MMAFLCIFMVMHFPGRERGYMCLESRTRFLAHSTMFFVIMFIITVSPSLVNYINIEGYPTLSHLQRNKGKMW